MREIEMTREKWESEYIRLALASRFEFTTDSAAEEARDSWEDNDRERGDDPMPMPSHAIAEDMLEWMHR
jgi:hypothetical protein